MASISAALAVTRLPPLASLPRLKFATVISTAPSPASRRFRCRTDPDPLGESQQQEQSRPQPPSLLGIPTSTWSAGLGAMGFLEAGYLTYLKLAGAEAFCPIAGGSCGDVLNSDYAAIYGLPLPLFGTVAYGLVTWLSFQQSRKTSLSGLGDADARLILLGTTTTMATASAYFLYLLSTKFAGTTCSYCLLSAALSFSLFLVTLKGFGLGEIKNLVGFQLAVAGVVIAALTNSYSVVDLQASSSDGIVLEPYETVITNQSTPFAISLAKHLRSIGAKMYGAFWCSHCNEQKQMFGIEAAKILDYVECFPNGAGKGRQMTAECAARELEGFPTWIIKDKVLSGEQDLETLAEASGFVAEGSLSSPALS